MNYKIYNNDCLKQLDELEENSIDSIVTDPPYELNFMGKGWDNAGVSFNKETWEKCLKVLKPGGYLLAFGGSRTYHRIAVAIEDAGFEIRDTIMWLYGSGFPKSMDISKQLDKRPNRSYENLNLFGKKLKEILELNDDMDFIFEEAEREVIGQREKLESYQYKGNNVYQTNGNKEKIMLDITIPSTDLAKQWQGWGTALKPSFEPIIVARKPFKGSLVDNVIEYGVGGMNIDECRVGNEEMKAQVSGKTSRAFQSEATTTAGGKGIDHIGRFPANTILTYDETDFDEVCGGFPNTKSTPRTPTKGGTGGIGQATTFQRGSETSNFNDSGSASRYFYCAKASKKDRDEGLDKFEEKQMYRCDGSGNSLEIFGTTDGGRLPRKNFHPTVKPTELMQYLVRLVTPKGGIILDPFMGSGSTGKAVMFENKERKVDYKFIGIEREKEYCDIAKARIKYASKFEEEQKEKDNQISFDDLK